MAKRIQITARPDWKHKVESELGFDWHTGDNGEMYWDESAYWSFSNEEIDAIDLATTVVYEMVLKTIDHVITSGRVHEYGYAPAVAKLIIDSWDRSDDIPHLYGRFDFALTQGGPKLLEFNADTPTSLYECGVVQWYWANEFKPGADQFNSIHEKMVEHLRGLGVHQMHVTCVTPHPEDQGTVSYIEMLAREANIDASFVPVEQIGLRTDADGTKTFVDLEDRRINTLFKLVPWEWLLSDEFGPELIRQATHGRINIIEPAWKMLAANKMLMADMWKMFPNSQYLLPSFASIEEFKSAHPFDDYVVKPIFGREGQNVGIYHADGSTVASEEGYCEGEPMLYQLRTQLPVVDGNYSIVGSWVINGWAAGMGVRESTSPITNNLGRFVPHIIE